MAFDPEHISKIAPIFTAISAAIVAIVAVLTLALIARRQISISELQYNDNWEKSFISLYEDFWSNDDLRTVRFWILSDEGYGSILPALKRRLESGSASLPREDFETLEVLDRFFAHLTMYIALHDAQPVKGSRIDWTNNHLQYWYALIARRSELVQYAYMGWPGLLDVENRDYDPRPKSRPAVRDFIRDQPPTKTGPEI